jgi:hypothetical protein
VNSFTIIGYAYEADVHCDPCAAARFGRCQCDQQDVHGEDSDGSEITPIFAGDEGVEELSCGDCHGPLL